MHDRPSRARSGWGQLPKSVDGSRHPVRWQLVAAGYTLVVTGWLRVSRQWQ